MPVKRPFGKRLQSPPTLMSSAWIMSTNWRARCRSCPLLVCSRLRHSSPRVGLAAQTIGDELSRRLRKCSALTYDLLRNPCIVERVACSIGFDHHAPMFINKIGSLNLSFDAGMHVVRPCTQWVVQGCIDFGAMRQCSVGGVIK